jgi:hypothetical protein
MSPHPMTTVLILNIYFPLFVLMLCIFSFVFRKKHRMRITYAYVSLFMASCYLCDIIYLELIRYGPSGLIYLFSEALILWPLFYIFSFAFYFVVYFSGISMHRGFSITCFCLISDALFTLFLVHS